MERTLRQGDKLTVDSWRQDPASVQAFGAMLAIEQEAKRRGELFGRLESWHDAYQAWMLARARMGDPWVLSMDGYRLAVKRESGSARKAG